MVHLLMSLTKCYLFYKSISTIESVKDYDLIWMFISGVMFMYLLYYAITFLILVFKHFQIFKTIYDLFETKYLLETHFNTFVDILNDIGVSLIFMLYKIQFIKSEFCFLFYFLYNTISFSDFCFSLEIRQLYLNFIKLIGFFVGIYYHYKYKSTEEQKENENQYELQLKVKD